jgi:hypothetical protein
LFRHAESAAKAGGVNFVTWLPGRYRNSMRMYANVETVTDWDLDCGLDVQVPADDIRTNWEIFSPTALPAVS